MLLSATTLRVAPERLALFQQNDAWPLPPPSWKILSDEQWEALKDEFDIPNISGGVDIRALLELHCCSMIDCRSEAKIQARCKSDDKAIRWMSKASNIGKSYKGMISEGVIYRLSHIGKVLNQAAGRILINADELNRARDLTIPVQLCALVCWDQAPRTRAHSCAPPIIEFYAALWRTWKEFLGRPITIWAHEGGLGASGFVKFATCLLRISQEQIPDDDAVAWKRVRARLTHVRDYHAHLLDADEWAPGFCHARRWPGRYRVASSLPEAHPAFRFFAPSLLGFAQTIAI